LLVAAVEIVLLVVFDYGSGYYDYWMLFLGGMDVFGMFSAALFVCGWVFGN
jgi:hypothetical protein